MNFFRALQNVAAQKRADAKKFDAMGLFELALECRLEAYKLERRAGQALAESLLEGC